MEKRGEIRAEDFERTAMIHTESLLQAAFRLTETRAAAEDLVQETLLRAWRAFGQFETETDCKAWLFRILFNCSNERHRRKRSRPQTVSVDNGEARETNSMRAESTQHNKTDVISALDSLAEDHRVVLILTVVEGFTCKETAEMLDVPIGTIMSRLSRARANLRQALIH